MATTPIVAIRPKSLSDDVWVRAILTDGWASTMVASLSGLHDAALLDGCIARIDGKPVGLATY